MAIAQVFHPWSRMVAILSNQKDPCAERRQQAKPTSAMAPNRSSMTSAAGCNEGMQLTCSRNCANNSPDKGRPNQTLPGCTIVVPYYFKQTTSKHGAILRHRDSCNMHDKPRGFTSSWTSEATSWQTLYSGS